MNEILAVAPRPTAVLAANNFIAFGALRALPDERLRVPDDMSLATFDDLPKAWHQDPWPGSPVSPGQ